MNTKKQTYAIGFAIYGLSEFYRATQKDEALQIAIKLYESIEKYAFDKEQKGYVEAMTRQWEPIEDMRLSSKDANECFTMNTHLHILEPYSNLFRIWHTPKLEERLRNLVSIFTEKILDTGTYHLGLFFNERWESKSPAFSYGHDIEAAWLLYEAAEVLGDKDLLKELIPITLKITDAATEGLLSDGSMIYEKNENHVDNERHWWVQAEAVVGYMYANKNSGEKQYKDKAIRIWKYIQEQIIDHEHGEWYWSRLDNKMINRSDDKAGFWKCPYHNGRMCLEMIEHFHIN